MELDTIRHTRLKIVVKGTQRLTRWPNMIVLVVSPLCLGEGPIVTIKDVLAVPAEKDVDVFQKRTNQNILSSFGRSKFLVIKMTKCFPWFPQSKKEVTQVIDPSNVDTLHNMLTRGLTTKRIT